MSDYQPGTVAWATVRGQSSYKVMRILTSRGLRWVSTANDAGQFLHVDVDLTDIRPLVVLDLDPTVVTEPMGAKRNDYQRLIDMLRETADNFFTPDAAALARKVADQIEAQTKAPRIPEPGLWGVVEAHTEDGALRRRFVRHDDAEDGREWQRKSIRRAWDDLIDPVLIREGVQS